MFLIKENGYNYEPKVVRFHFGLYKKAWNGLFIDPVCKKKIKLSFERIHYTNVYRWEEKNHFSLIFWFLMKENEYYYEPKVAVQL